ncbi:MAG TPA: Fe-S cluster assembly ATPase SufC [Spirochaetia bacterium]|nr:Fe-S cluster assembly ATPase SufC [Spirochaetia bacterium]
MARLIQVRNLQASIAGKPILMGLDLDIPVGQIHALMGPNGSGKSTLANVLMGHPAYTVTGGTITLDGEDFLALTPDERSRKGVFLAFQYPVEIPGVTVGKFLKRAAEIRLDGKGMDVTGFIRRLRQAMDFMEIDQAFINRYLNQGFSGGEKKRMEILQMLILEPSFAVLDETDSGLDIDALKVVAKGVNRLRGEGFGALIITHYQRILTHIVPDFVHIMYKGRIVTSGGKDLVETLENRGYDWIRSEYGIEEDVHEVASAGNR